MKVVPLATMVRIEASDVGVVTRVVPFSTMVKIEASDVRVVVRVVPFSTMVKVEASGVDKDIAITDVPVFSSADVVDVRSAAGPVLDSSDIVYD